MNVLMTVVGRPFCCDALCATTVLVGAAHAGAEAEALGFKASRAAQVQEEESSGVAECAPSCILQVLQACEHLDDNLWLRRHTVAQTFFLLACSLVKNACLKRGTSTAEHFLPSQQGATCRSSIAKNEIVQFSKARCRKRKYIHSSV